MNPLTGTSTLTHLSESSRSINRVIKGIVNTINHYHSLLMIEKCLEWKNRHQLQALNKVCRNCCKVKLQIRHSARLQFINSSKNKIIYRNSYLFSRRVEGSSNKMFRRFWSCRKRFLGRWLIQRSWGKIVKLIS